jgi:uncharacterized membrane protein YphA (DoxX/SURF4 family)
MTAVVVMMVALGIHHSSQDLLDRDSDLDCQESRPGQSRPLAVVVAVVMMVALGIHHSSQDLLDRDSDPDCRESRHCQSQPLAAVAAVGAVLYPVAEE